jgi:hypothetical protein
MQMKTMAGEYDPIAYTSVADALTRAGTVKLFDTTAEKFVESVQKATLGIWRLLKAYQEGLEAEQRWEDEGGACYDRGE